MEDISEFAPVTYQKDIDRVYGELGAKTVSVYGIAYDNLATVFSTERVQKNELVLKLVDGSIAGLAAGARVDLLFGLDEGQFLIQTEVVRVEKLTGEPDRLITKLDAALRRLQRRNHFRAPVRKSQRVQFSIDRSPEPWLVVEAIDLSAGGIRMKWPVEYAAPEPNRQLKTRLELRGVRDLLITAHVRSVARTSDGTFVGLEFEKLKPVDEQAIVTVCVQLRRDAQPSLR
jgi:hypothetical protein